MSIFILFVLICRLQQSFETQNGILIIGPKGNLQQTLIQTVRLCMISLEEGKEYLVCIRIINGERFCQKHNRKQCNDKQKIIISDGGPCFGWRLSLNHPYQWISYDQALERSLNFGSGLVSMGLKPNSSSIVGIYSR